MTLDANSIVIDAANDAVTITGTLTWADPANLLTRTSTDYTFTIPLTDSPFDSSFVAPEIPPEGFVQLIGNGAEVAIGDPQSVSGDDTGANLEVGLYATDSNGGASDLAPFGIAIGTFITSDSSGDQQWQTFIGFNSDYTEVLQVNASLVTNPVSGPNLAFIATDIAPTPIVIADLPQDIPGPNDDFIDLSGLTVPQTVDTGIGDDTVIGSSAGDSITGGAGFDSLEGGAGNDTLDGGAQADILYGGADDDVLIGGDGFDNMFGEAGNDSLFAGAAADRVFGGDGDDLIRAGTNFGTSVDGVEGGAGNDTIFGEGGFDLLIGGDGDDYIDGGNQADDLRGEAGNDTLIGGDGFDRLFGGTGDDLLQDFSGFGGLFGDAGNDTIQNGAEAVNIFGGSGNDLIEAGGGDDNITGNAGFDTLNGGTGNDTLRGAFNADTFVFADGDGSDVVLDFDALNALEKIDLSAVTAITSLADLDLASTTLGAATQVGADVVIDTGGGNSVMLLGVSLGDLDGGDFIF